jgi:hypothetical protein
MPRLTRLRSLHFFGVRKLVLGERANSRAQDFAVEAVLSPEVVIDGGLVYRARVITARTVVSLYP